MVYQHYSYFQAYVNICNLQNSCFTFAQFLRYLRIPALYWIYTVHGCLKTVFINSAYFEAGQTQ
jgi:hypothetical protein